MIDVEPNPSIKCTTIRRIIGFEPDAKRVYLAHEDGSITWCTMDVSSRVPVFRVGNTLPEVKEEAEIIAHFITEGSRWFTSGMEFEAQKGWSDVALQVMFAYNEVVKEMV